ncbi:tetratricopeptide repeat protein [Christensenellaceae bacterium OttesenSCG-928-K19]|nr:tetratricopeptide repeat protein [Christensenellaceae bacterium OttesenSCG-928-K19]
MSEETTRIAFYEELDKLYATGDIGAVEEYLQKELNAHVRTCARCYDSLEISALNELGTLYRNTGRIGEAISSFESARKIIEIYLGTDSLEYAMILNNLAGAYRLCGEAENALKLYLACLVAYEGAMGRENRYYCGALNDIALICQQLGRFSDAEEYLLLAVELLQQLPDGKQEYAAVCENLGYVYESVDNSGKALEWLSLAKKAREELGETGTQEYENLTGRISRLLGNAPS